MVTRKRTHKQNPPTPQPFLLKNQEIAPINKSLNPLNQQLFLLKNEKAIAITEPLNPLEHPL
jgi:hypothetical protein